MQSKQTFEGGQIIMKEQESTQNANVLAIPDNTIPGFGNKMSLELALRAANILSKSTLVPREYQDNLPNCVIALNMASRMGADPLMVMQNLYIVHGHPGWSSQFLISTFNTCGRFSALRYEWSGEKGKDSFGCKAWAMELKTGDRLEGSTVTIDIAKKEGWFNKPDKNGKESSKWPSMTEQMLMYRAASFFIRAYAPELAMGMHTSEEIFDTYDLSKDDYSVKVDQEIKANANSETIDITPPSPEPKPEPEQGDSDSNPADADTGNPSGGQGQSNPSSSAGPGF
jgi:hypothetical protein